MHTYNTPQLSNIIGIICLGWMISSCLPVKESSFQGEFMGVKADSIPRLLAPDLLAASTEEYNGTFSPDGKEFFFTTDVPGKAYITVTRMQADNSWSSPSVASFSGTYIDYDPLFSPDGQSLYFSSTRPLPNERDQRSVSRIWVVHKQGEGWGMPEYIPIMTSEKDAYYSSFTKDGRMYFNRWSTGKLFTAQDTGGGFEIKEMPAPLHSGSDKGDPFISPEEDYLIFRSYGPNSFGMGDLYISFKLDNQWTDAQNLGQPINSPYHEMCPWVSHDGKYFIFASSRKKEEWPMASGEPISIIHDKHQSKDNGETNIYIMSADFIDEIRLRLEKP